LARAIESISAKMGDDVILLGGGDKSTQDDDIKIAKERWSDYNA
jgi:putative component of toxin-antitoxin plasmid stabilization module